MTCNAWYLLCARHCSNTLLLLSSEQPKERGGYYYPHFMGEEI